MIIVGLGNPGKEYDHTRHNLGFMVVDELVKKNHGQWKKEGGVMWSKIGEHFVIKPQDFMNASGSSLLTFLKYKGLKASISDMHVAAGQFIVVHDDLDFPLGEIHEQVNRSAGGHNGVQSIIDALVTQNFFRLRIGIGNNRDLNLPAGRQDIPAEEYVLQKFTGDELKTLSNSVNEAVAMLEKKIL